MQTSVIFTANTQAGNTTRLSLAIKRLGYKLLNVSLASKPDEPVDLITLIIESEQTLAKGDFESIVSSISSVTGVDVMHGQGAKPSGAAPKSEPATRQPTTASTMVRSKPAANSRKVTAKDFASSETVTEAEKAAIVKREGRRLVGLYPAIYQPVMLLESEFDRKLRDELMQRIGKAVGHWQYKSRFTKKEGLDKTVRGSLNMQRTQFSGMPVISDLLFAGAKKEKELKVASADPLTQMETALSDFLDVSIVDGTITVTNCPHCSCGRSPVKPDCYFVREFVQGFMVDIKSLEGALVVQLTSKGTGDSACTFEIRQAV